MLADVNGVRIGYEVFGEGEPVLLLSGFAACRSYWKRMMPLLEGYRCVAVDNRGVGETEYSGGFSIDDLADDAVSLMSYLGYERFHAVGWSMGSSILLSMSSRHPERLITQTLVSTYRDRPARTTYVLGEFTRMLYEGEVTMEAFYVMVNSFCFPEGFFRKLMASGMDVPLPKDDMDPRGLRDQILAVEDFGKHLQYDSIDVPTLIVQGTEDIMTPFEQGDAVRRSIKGAELVPIPGAGHNIDQRLYADAVKGFMAGHRV